MNTFEQTVEEYKEEIITSQDDITMEEFYQVELELDNITVELYKESNNLEAIEFAENDLSIRALAIANGVGIEQSKDFTIESSKDSLIKKLWEKLKLMIKKAHMFMTKWVGKALILFMKSDDKRKKLLDDLSSMTDDEFNLTKLPESILRKISSLGKASGNIASESTLLSFITFINIDFTGNIHDKIEEIKRVTGKDMYNERRDDYEEYINTITSIKYLSRGRYFIVRKEKEKEIIETSKIEINDLLRIGSKFMDGKKSEGPTIESLNINKDYVIKELEKSKKDLQKEINDVYDKFKKEGSMGKDSTSKDITTSLKTISNGIIWVKSVVAKAKDAVVVATIATSDKSDLSINIPNDIQTMIKNDDYSAMRKASIDPKTEPLVVLELVDILDMEDGLDDSKFKPDEQYKRDERVIKFLKAEYKTHEKETSLRLRQLGDILKHEPYSNSYKLTKEIENILSNKKEE